jgi:hypothetical protein
MGIKILSKVRLEEGAPVGPPGGIAIATRLMKNEGLSKR